jgi:all-trans-8'-apo-beta-carotenal 15,15'-oxygenase
MERRDFIRSLIAGLGAGALGTVARAADAPDPVFAAFEAQRAKTPWTLGFDGLQADVEPMRLTLQGRLPHGLQGAFFRNGAARHQLGGQRYHHWFDGDGMVQKYQIGDGAIVHRGRFVRTPKFIADSAAGRPVRQAFGTHPPGAERLASPDDINVANTSVVQHGGELMALWEGGSATRIDATTLETRGPKVWSPDHAGMPFSAHPKIEPDGTLWNFGVASYRELLAIYRINAAGELAQTALLQVPQIAMVHDFAVTERHLVFLLPPLVFDRERADAGETFLDSHVWKPGLGLRVLVLAKDKLDAPRYFELPAGFVFHIGNAWERDGVIRLDFMRTADAWHATTGIKQMMQGRYTPHEHAALTLLEIDTRRGRVQQTALPHIAEFPRVDPRVVGRRYRQLFAAERVAPGERPGYDAVMRIDVESGRVERYRYGADVMAEEHIFVPRPGGTGEGDGWLLGSALDLKRRAMLFSVFDARRLAAGPLVQGTLARVMPLGLHAIFVGAA